ncbi:hypothetical protein [Oceanobacillus kapialis]|uniref:DUF3137 domain-containing protein n=1 Tax=Oceanobacillus kapialis TaxID=481353 RepID=A0ABW5Q097_9BACI
MKKILFFIIGWCIVVALVIMVIVQNPNSFFVNGTIILGWLLFLLQLTWNNSEYFYIKIKRYWFFLKNPDCIWNMQIEFEGDFDENTFDKIDHLFNKQNSNLRIINLSNSRKIYRSNTLSFEVTVRKGLIQVHLEDLEVSFRRSRKIIDEEIGILLEEFSKILKEDNVNYYFNINFKEFNPYYGFFIRRLNAKNINTFNIKFNIESDKVTINKKSIEIYTKSLQKMNSFSKEYLSLSPR